MTVARVKGCCWAWLVLAIALHGDFYRVIGHRTIICNPVDETSSFLRLLGSISDQLASVLSSLDQLKRENVEIQRKQQESEDMLRSNFDLLSDLKQEMRRDFASIKHNLLQLSLAEDIFTLDSYEKLRSDQEQLKADVASIKERVLECTTHNFTAESFDQLRRENAEMQAEARADIAGVISHVVEAAGNDTQTGIRRLSEQQAESRSGLEQALSETKLQLEQVLVATESINATRLSVHFASTKPRDCGDVMYLGFKSSGVYAVYTGITLRPVLVYCDMTTDGGGWTVFQRRQDGSENFYRDWIDYANGFGDLHREFWIGNDNLHSLTNGGKRYELRVDLGDFNGTTRYAKYSDFKIGSSGEKYKLISLRSFSGDAGDSLSYHLGMRFSTKDQDNDNHPTTSYSCATARKGAWWYNACHYSNLNGHYHGGSHASHGDGVNWVHWTGWNYSLRFSEMKFRPAS